MRSIHSRLLLMISFLTLMFSCASNHNIFLNKTYQTQLFTKPTIAFVFHDEKFNLYGAGRPDSLFGAGDVKENALNFFKNRIVKVTRDISGLDISNGKLTGTYTVQKGTIIKKDGSYLVEYPVSGSLLPLSEDIEGVDLVCIFSNIIMGNDITETQSYSLTPFGTVGYSYSSSTSKLLTGANMVLWDNKKREVVFYARLEGLSQPVTLKRVTEISWMQAITELSKKFYKSIPLEK